MSYFKASYLQNPPWYDAYIIDSGFKSPFLKEQLHEVTGWKMATIIDHASRGMAPHAQWHHEDGSVSDSFKYQQTDQLWVELFSKNGKCFGVRWTDLGTQEKLNVFLNEKDSLDFSSASFGGPYVEKTREQLGIDLQLQL